MQKKIILIIGLVMCALNAHAKARHLDTEEYWWLCPVDQSIPLRPEYSSDKTPLENTEVRSDTARVVDKGITYFNGDVEFIRGQISTLSNEVSYDQENDVASFAGDANLWGPNLLWQGDHARYDFADHLSRLQQGRYWLTERQGRGQADRIIYNSETKIARLLDADYTTCPRNSETWKFSATKIRLDFKSNRGSATNALLRLYNIPVLYIPYITFPISEDRKSGFLSPSLITSSKRGVDLTVPYYWNIAPNQDATVGPRIVGNHGTMLTGQYRHLGQESKSQFDFEYLPSDSLDNNKTRGQYELTHQQYYDQKHGFVNVLVQGASDAQYYEDFGNSLSVTSQSYLDRRIETIYSNSKIWVDGLFQGYQSLNSTIPDAFGPYRRLPQITAQTLFPESSLTPHLYAIGQYTYFDRGQSVAGNRLNIEPKLSLPFIKPWVIIRPAVSVKYTQYLLTGTENVLLDKQVFASSLSRAIPTFSIDSQFFFERRFRFLGERLLQTLEPRIYYLVIPKQGQSQYPVFDTALYNFQFINFFLDNRFAGLDRVGDTNQLTVATTSRLYSSESGRELIRGSVGEIFYFRDREVTLPGATALDSSVSELIGEVNTRLTADLAARVSMQWDPDTQRTDRSAFALHYSPRDGTIVNLGYQQIRPSIISTTTPAVEQTDVSFRVPMTESLSLIGRWEYSLLSNKSVETVGGVEYESCCWGARIYGRRFITNTQGQFDTTLFFELELKGFAGYGRNAQAFLKRSIPGYEAKF